MPASVKTPENCVGANTVNGSLVKDALWKERISCMSTEHMGELLAVFRFSFVLLLHSSSRHDSS